MTIHVPIGEAEKRLSELVAAAVRGEDVVLDQAGAPQVRLVPIEEDAGKRRTRLAARRRSAFGMYKSEFAGVNTSIEALEADRGEPEERTRRKFGPSD